MVVDNTIEDINTSFFKTKNYWVMRAVNRYGAKTYYVNKRSNADTPKDFDLPEINIYTPYQTIVDLDVQAHMSIALLDTFAKFLIDVQSQAEEIQKAVIADVKS